MGGLLKFVKVVASCMFLIFLASNGASIPTKILENYKNGSIIYPESFYLVGVADGKSFFVDNDNFMNWTSAKAYCESMNMQLASITSEAQATLLDNSWDENKFDHDYWTSGRDALDIRQFVWEHNLERPNRAYNKVGWKAFGIQSCLVYYSSSGSSIYSIFPCITNKRPMCDTGNLN